MSHAKVATFEITGNNDVREYERLVNDPNVVVSAKSDFFAAVPTDDGVVPVITRVVDYRELPRSDRSVYSAPLA